jgi:hypothetical protein
MHVDPGARQAPRSALIEAQLTIRSLSASLGAQSGNSCGRRPRLVLAPRPDDRRDEQLGEAHVGYPTWKVGHEALHGASQKQHPLKTNSFPGSGLSQHSSTRHQSPSSTSQHKTRMQH